MYIYTNIYIYKQGSRQESGISQCFKNIMEFTTRPWENTKENQFSYVSISDESWGGEQNVIYIIKQISSLQI